MSTLRFSGVIMVSLTLLAGTHSLQPSENFYWAHIGTSPSKVEFSFHGLKIRVHDLQTSKQFYGDVLGMNLKETGDSILITGQSFPIFLTESEQKSTNRYPKLSRTGLTLQTDKLLPTIDQLRRAKIHIFDTLLSRNGVGISIPFQDPSGNVLSLMEVQVYDPGKIEGFQVYNSGITISNMDSAIHFYQKIMGFEDWSRNYLPQALPLKNREGTFAFMIHYRKGLLKNDAEYNVHPQITLILKTNDLEEAKVHLEQSNIQVVKRSDHLICRDFEGNWLEIVNE
jgi:catechol-2,3-dioxygenase